MARQIIVVDCETNGLNPKRHEAWEIAWHNLATDESGCFFVALDLPQFMANADLDALRINRFVDRYPKRLSNEALSTNRPRVGDLYSQLCGNTLAGSNPSFDAAMVQNLLDKVIYGGESLAPWHHRMWDLSAYAAGVLGLGELPGLAKVCELLDIEPGDHTAEADVTATGLCFRELQARARRAGEAS